MVDVPSVFSHGLAALSASLCDVVMAPRDVQFVDQRGGGFNAIAGDFLKTKEVERSGRRALGHPPCGGKSSRRSIWWWRRC